MFKYLDDKAQLIRERIEKKRLEERQGNSELVTSIAFVTLAESGSIDEVTATEHTDLFSPWASGMVYEVGALRRYNDVLYRCLQAHTSQADWTPEVSPSLWTKVGDPLEEYPAWSQPIGAQDAYAKGDKCTHGDKRWISDVDANVWEPSVYGWTEVTK